MSSVAVQIKYRIDGFCPGTTRRTQIPFPNHPNLTAHTAECGGENLVQIERKRGGVGSVVLSTLQWKWQVDAAIHDTLNKVLILLFGRATDTAYIHLDDILAKSFWVKSKFSTIAFVDMDSEEMQVYIDYFDIMLVPVTIFFLQCPSHEDGFGHLITQKWIGSFSSKQDFIDVAEAIFRGAMKGKPIVSCPLPPERIPRFQLLFKDV